MSYKSSIPASGRFMIALHPGEVLRELYLEPLGLSVDAAAAALDLPRQHLSEILNGHRDVTPDVAQRLEAKFRASARSLAHHADQLRPGAAPETPRLGLWARDERHCRATNPIVAQAVRHPYVRPR